LLALADDERMLDTLSRENRLRTGAVYLEALF
jgi:hypothetical protein